MSSEPSVNPERSCPDREQLLEYAVGKLAEAPAELVANHVESCADCQAELATFSGHDDTLILNLRRADLPDSFLDEPECQDALAQAKAVLHGGQAEPASVEISASALTQQLGEYHLIERLGAGGMGTVYKALHSKLDRVVALKVLPKSRLDDPRAVIRFEREMKAIGRLDHPHIVRAYDAREIDGRLVLAMEYVEGLDLGKIVRCLGRLDVADACEVARQAALALQAAHEHGLIHRDIKPSNLMLAAGGAVKLLDLGLARFYEEPGGLSQFSRSTDVPSSAESLAAKMGLSPSVAEEMTSTGQAMGTADYMAPEQASDSRAVDIRADIYSLGATLYKLLSGQAPFGDPNHQGTFDKLLAHRQEPVPPIGELCPEISDALAAVLDRMLAKDPGLRFATPVEAAAALAPFCTNANLPKVLSEAKNPVRSPLPLGEGQGEGRSKTNKSGQSQSHSQANPLRQKEAGQGTANGPGDSSNLHPAAGGQGSWIRRIAVALLIGGFGFALGIVVMIVRDGKTTKLEVPDGTQVAIDAQGNPTVNIPGNPESASETQATTTQASKPSDAPLQFGPVAEQIINIQSEGTQAALDLASGKLLDLPKESATWPLQQQDQWAADNRVDLLVDHQEVSPGGGFDGGGLNSLIPKGLRLAAVTEELWEGIDSGQLDGALASAAPGASYPDGFTVATISERRGITSYSPHRLPVTFAFQTRNGDRGLLQVLRFTEEPAGMRIRYKLAKPSPAALAAIPDEKAIQGTWEVVSSTMQLLQVLPGEAQADSQQIFKTTKVVIWPDSLKIVGDHVRSLAFEYHITPQPDGRQSTIDLELGQQFLGTVAYGICQLDRAKHELKICTSGLHSVAQGGPDPKSARPSRFQAEFGSKEELLTLRRVGDAAIADDEKVIQGMWRVESVSGTPSINHEHDNRDPGCVAKAANLRLAGYFAIGNRLAISHHGITLAKAIGGGEQVPAEYATIPYALDPTRQPRRIDLATTDFPTPPRPVAGLYELQDDRLTLCLALFELPRIIPPRPGKMEGGPKSLLVVLRRIAQDADLQTDDTKAIQEHASANLAKSVPETQEQKDHSPTKPAPEEPESQAAARMNAMDGIEKRFQEIEAQYKTGEINAEVFSKAKLDRDLAVAEQKKGDEKKRAIAQAQLDHAERIFQYADVRFKAGFRVTALQHERAKLARDLAAAELEGNAVAAARIKLEGTKKILGILERQQKTGGIPIEEVSKAKLALDEAQAEWDALKPKDETPPEPKAEPERPTPPATPTATPP